jgi:transposase
MATEHDCIYQTQAQELSAQVAALKARMEELERQLAGEKKRAIGRTSERKRPTPASNARDKNDKQAQVERKTKREAQRRLDSEVVPHRIPEPERGACVECGGTTFIELPADISTEFEWVPGRLVRKLHQRETLCCTQCKHIERAPAPARVVDGGKYGPAFIAHIVVEKCADCVPLYRQVKMLRRYGLDVARSTLIDQFHRAAELISPLYERMRERIAERPVVYADETSLKMQRVEKLGFVWTFATEHEVVYEYSPDRSGDTPKDILGESDGVLVVDGYTGYNHVTVPGRRVRAGCNAHARRKFVDIEDDGAKKIVEHFGDVFRVEREANERQIVGTAAHLELRRTRSKAAMDAIATWCREHKDEHTPKSPMGQAIGYVINQWAPLTVFLDDIRIEPSNMISERLLRTIALGRKNYLFVGHEEGGKNLAKLCSIIATCTLHRLNPAEYLADVLIRVQNHPANDIDALLPDKWSPARKPTPTDSA